jgi:hypothetical protein
MSRRYLVGGPKNSGKSTFVLSLTEYLKSRGRTAEAVELDIWGNSYPAFRGEVSFDERPKSDHLDWPWREKLQPRLDQYLASDAEFVFGDMPGVWGAAICHMCEQIGKKTDGAFVVSRTLEGLDEWRRFFAKDFFIRIAFECLTMTKRRPLVIVGMNRLVQGDHPDVVPFAEALLAQR